MMVWQPRPKSFTFLKACIEQVLHVAYYLSEPIIIQFEKYG